MPELPEVQTVVDGLNETVRGKTVVSVKIKETARIYPSKKRFISLLINSKFVAISRRGKNILIELSNGHTLWVHLKMTGHFYYLPKKHRPTKHDHVVLGLKNDINNLRFNDYRRFGYLKIYPTSEIFFQKGLVELGPEPLEISSDDFVELFKSRRRMIKPALLDQSMIVGVGNIYADESLWLARIHPERLTDSLSKSKLAELHGHIQSIMKKAILNMGTSVDSFAGVNAKPGGYQKYLVVYGREAQPCFRCEHPIKRMKIGSRSAHFCRFCQRPR